MIKDKFVWVRGKDGYRKRLMYPVPRHPECIFKVEGFSKNYANNNWWWVQCQCGKRVEMKASNVVRQKSCGCQKHTASRHEKRYYDKRSELKGMSEFEKMCFREHSKYHDKRNQFILGRI